MHLVEFSEFDRQCMQKALALAWKGRYSTSPNPRVGCIITIADEIIAEGFHYIRGGPHAEIDALSKIALDQDLTNATVYVTLEPCSHFGATSPCALALTKRNIKRLVAAMLDPNPLVKGKGFHLLETAGITTQYGLLESQARDLNKGFLSRIERQRPYVILKMGVSLDGKTALRNGQSQWITSEISRANVQDSRARACAILTGIGTVLKDNPHLNVRSFNTPRQPIRIILDSHLNIPLDSFVVNDHNSPTWIVTLQQANYHKLRKLSKYPHIKVITAEEQAGHICLTSLMQTLAKLEIGELYLECGAVLAGAFLSAHLIDEIQLYQAPIILGTDAIDAFSFEELTDLKQASTWHIKSYQKLGEDMKFVLCPRNNF